MKKIGKLLDRHSFFLFTVPSVILYAIFFITPMFMGLMYSFTDWNGLTKKYNYVWFDNYVQLFQDDRIYNSLAFTFKYTIVLTVLTVIIALIIAILLNQKIKGRGFFRTTYYFPAVLSMITVGLIWNQIYAHALPTIGAKLGVDALETNILIQPNLVFYGLIVVALWQGVATPTLLFLAGLQGVPDDLLEAAQIDGASKWQQFRSVIVPFLIPVLNIVIILTVKSGLTTFDYIMALTGGGPARMTESVGYLVYNFAFIEFKFSYANALAVVLFVIIGIVSLIQIKTTSRYEVNR